MPPVAVAADSPVVAVEPEAAAAAAVAEAARSSGTCSWLPRTHTVYLDAGQDSGWCTCWPGNAATTGNARKWELERGEEEREEL